MMPIPSLKWPKRSLWGQEEAAGLGGPNYIPLKPKEGHEEQQYIPPANPRQIFQWLNWGLFFVSVACLGLAYGQSHQAYQWHLKQTLAFCTFFFPTCSVPKAYADNRHYMQLPFLKVFASGDSVPRYEENELFDRPSAYSVYRGPPSEKVNAAWEAISDVGVVTISGEDVRKVGKDTSKSVKAPEHWGLGDDAYLAQIDGQHRIHCLNIPRKWMHYDHYFRPQLGDEPGIIQLSHRDHCLVLLLQTLTCQLSMDVITHNWMDTQQYPVPDFNMNRKCMNHENILGWQSNNRIMMDQWDEIAPQSGDFNLPLWPGLIGLNRLAGYNVTYKDASHGHGHGGH